VPAHLVFVVAGNGVDVHLDVDDVGNDVGFHAVGQLAARNGRGVVTFAQRDPRSDGSAFPESPLRAGPTTPAAAAACRFPPRPTQLFLHAKGPGGSIVDRCRLRRDYVVKITKPNNLTKDEATQSESVLPTGGDTGRRM
jgi:hypothetical protein